ncbi:UNVERIFIED_CONTAM: hypothetical protein GTU68_008512 [Idotea baltica]|nr:hypothetical protein [Idotea baltica]
MATAIRKVSSALGKVAAANSLLTPKCTLKAQTADMISKALRDHDYKRPPPFDYKNSTYGVTAALFDKTTWRFDENSKIIVVDGPVASGKSKVAQHIASEFDMLYIPQVNMDRVYVNSYGFDMRTLNHRLPKKVQSFEPKDFHLNPKDNRATNMEMELFRIRLGQYLDALTHLLCTGQGVVMNRSVFSDFVFVETNLDAGILPPTLRKLYNMTWDCIRPDLMRPHLVVYLDTPVDIVRKNLAKRNTPGEVNSPVHTTEVLKMFEDIYKQKFLKTISSHAELLVYDWSSEVDLEILVEDIERLNLDDYTQHDPKMADWRLVDEWAWCGRRMDYTKNRRNLEIWAENIPYYDCPEILVSGQERLDWLKVFEASPGNKWAAGYNSEMGDANVMFKI